MYAYIDGIVGGIGADWLIVENNGIGYEVTMPSSDLSQAGSLGSPIRVYTYFQVSENGIGLYGFLGKDEKEFFTKLLSVNGVGPKAAIAILSVATVSDLKFAILSDDEKLITAANGVGPKLAKRIILELKEKLDLGETFEGALAANNADNVSSGVNGARNDCLQALVALGYSSQEVLKAMNRIEYIEDMDTEQMLKETLKKL